MIRAIEFRGPDRVPLTHFVLPAALEKHGDRLTKIIDRYPGDTGPSGFRGPEAEGSTYDEGRFRDEFGVEWDNLHRGINGVPVGHPLADLGRLQRYKFPDLSVGDWSQVNETVRSHDKYAMGSGGNLFERMQWLRGYEALMVDFATRDRRVYELRDRLVDCFLGQIEKWCETEVQGISFADDWGTQQALMVSPRFWDEFFRPAYQRIFEPCLKAGKHIHFHSDGWVWEIIGRLRDIGCSVVNVQQSLMGVHRVAKEFGGTVCFRTDLDRQHVLPHGTPEQVREHVREVLGALMPFNGGVIAQGDIGPDVPLANVEAMYQAIEEFGRY